MKNEFYQLAAQIIAGEQKELALIMLDQMSEWTGKEIKNIDKLTVGEIVGWLIDNQEAIQPFIV